jgi:hypothetical protein
MNTHVRQNLGGNARSFDHSCKQQVLGPDVWVIELIGFLLGKVKNRA